MVESFMSLTYTYMYKMLHIVKYIVHTVLRSWNLKQVNLNIKVIAAAQAQIYKPSN